MAKDDGAKQRKDGAGCLCWDCARLGGCPRASCRIKRCRLFVNSVIRIQDIAAAFGVCTRTLQRYIQKRGRQWLISAAAAKGLHLVHAAEKRASWCVRLPYKGIVLHSNAKRRKK